MPAASSGKPPIIQRTNYSTKHSPSRDIRQENSHELGSGISTVGNRVIPREQTLISVEQVGSEEISICLGVGDCPVERDCVVLVPDSVRGRVKDSNGSCT